MFSCQVDGYNDLHSKGQGLSACWTKTAIAPIVGIILLNRRNEVFWGKRIREHSWQFPQGGIKRGESPEQAMFRELEEEVGLRPDHVRIIARTRDWLRYEVPDHWVRREWRGHYRGQKQNLVFATTSRPRQRHSIARIPAPGV